MSVNCCKLLLLSLSAFCAAGVAFGADVVSSGTPSTVIAKQSGVVVTLDDVDAFAQRIPAEKRAGFFNSPSRIDNVIGSLLLQKQLAAQARKEGLDRDPKTMSRIQMSMDETLSAVRMERFRSEIQFPDFSELAREDYIAHKSKYVVHGKVEVQHILIDTKSRSATDAEALAEKVRAEAIAHPDTFEKLVEKYSDDPSKVSNQGKMQNAGDDTKYAAEFAAASNALKSVGDISPVVKTSFGYHILKLVARTPEQTPSFAEVRADIIAGLRKSYIDKQVSTYTDNLRNLPIEGNAELANSLRERYNTAAAASN